MRLRPISPAGARSCRCLGCAAGPVAPRFTGLTGEPRSRLFWRRTSWRFAISAACFGSYGTTISNVELNI